MSASSAILRAASCRLVDVVVVAPPAHAVPHVDEGLVQEQLTEMTQHQQNSVKGRRETGSQWWRGSVLN